MYGEDVYSSPQKHGLEAIGDIEWDDEAYSFNMTAVWRDPQTGQLYWADDSGCSCPSPFEDSRSRDDLTTGTADELDAHLKGQLELAADREAAGQVADLLLRIRSADR
jgi:hypothetical protein